MLVDPILLDFGRRLRHWRKLRKLTLAQVARGMWGPSNENGPNVAAYERGRNPTLLTIERFARVLNVSPAQLISDEVAVRLVSPKPVDGATLLQAMTRLGPASLGALAAELFGSSAPPYRRRVTHLIAGRRRHGHKIESPQRGVWAYKGVKNDHRRHHR